MDKVANGEKINSDGSPHDIDRAIPLCVDLDGTLIGTDLTWEYLLELARINPLVMLCVPGWLTRGRAFLKRQLAAKVTVEADRLPVHRTFLEFVRREKMLGRRIVLATASDEGMAAPIVARLSLFDEVWTSDGRRNLRGKAKAKLLCDMYGWKKFDYAGNSRVDLPVWAAARSAIVVNASDRVLKSARAIATISRVFERFSKLQD